MSELLPIWNSNQLAAGASQLSPFAIPNNPNAKGLIINNQSKYWLLISLNNTGKTVDRIEPFSHLIIPYEADLSLSVDSNAPISTLSPDHQFVDYSTVNTPVSYTKGSTQFSGASTVDVSSAQITMTATNVTVNNGGSGSLIDASGSIAGASQSQTIVPALTTRKYFLFQNLSDTDMYVNFGGNASLGVGSIWIAPAGGSIEFGGGFGFCPSDSVSVICEAAGKPFTCKYS